MRNKVICIHILLLRTCQSCSISGIHCLYSNVYSARQCSTSLERKLPVPLYICKHYEDQGSQFPPMQRLKWSRRDSWKATVESKQVWKASKFKRSDISHWMCARFTFPQYSSDRENTTSERGRSVLAHTWRTKKRARSPSSSSPHVTFWLARTAFGKHALSRAHSNMVDRRG